MNQETRIQQATPNIVPIANIINKEGQKIEYNGGDVEVTMAMLMDVLMPEVKEGEEDATHRQILILLSNIWQTRSCSI